MIVLTANNDEAHEPFFSDLPCEMCRPRLLCMLQHSSHISTPLLTDAHFGSVIKKTNASRNPIITVYQEMVMSKRLAPTHGITNILFYVMVPGGRKKNVREKSIVFGASANKTAP